MVKYNKRYQFEEEFMKEEKTFCFVFLPFDQQKLSTDGAAESI